MLQIIKHPFNEEIGLKTILPSTRKLIVGSFPANKVTTNNKPRLNYYYGSKDSRFWDLFKEATGADFQFNSSEIQNYLISKGFGILDIVENCYRKDNELSSDEDLSIINQFDFPSLIFKNSVRDFYTTSQFVTSLLKKQITPLLFNKEVKVVDPDNFSYECVNGKFHKNGPEFNFRIFTLYSPSDNGLRGIKKGLNKKNEIKDPKEYRLLQYKALLNI